MSKFRRPVRWMGIALLSLGAGCSAGWSSTWIVGAPNTPCPNANFTTIGAAIAAANPGDVIKICPALYPEQLLITKPLTLVGISEQGIGRVLIQPTSFLADAAGFLAVVAVDNTSGVTISNVAIDASNNTVAGCGNANGIVGALAGIFFYNSSGIADGVAISGAELSSQTNCTTLFPGNGFGVEANENSAAPFSVTVSNSSIHDFGRNGVLVIGAGETADINGNSIQGVGPSTGVNQFGVFLALGATGRVTGNHIVQGNCGTIPVLPNCFNLRSEGVVLRAAGPGVVIDGNFISNVQAGIFVNGAENESVTGNTITNVDALNGVQIQGSVFGLFAGNRIFHAGPLTDETCGIADISGSGSSMNTITGNWVNDAYCGVSWLASDIVGTNVYLNTLYETLNGAMPFPPPTEP